MTIQPAIQSDAFSEFQGSKTRISRRDIVRDLADNFHEKCERDRKSAYFITLTSPEARDTTLTAWQANGNFQKFHVRLLEHLAGSSRISRPWFRKIEHVIHAFIDIPNSKRKARRHLSKSARTSTIHHHAVVLCDSSHREQLDTLVDPIAAMGFVAALPYSCHVRTLNVQPIGRSLSDVVRVVDYSTQYARSHFSKPEWQDVYRVFPISSSEFQ